MTSSGDANNTIKKSSKYVLTVYDDTSGLLDGPYFKVSKLLTNINSSSSIDYYTIDVGYPGKDIVSNF